MALPGERPFHVLLKELQDLCHVEAVHQTVMGIYRNRPELWKLRPGPFLQ
jgi:hypothetical protein